jgi:hypothetical protein
MILIITTIPAGLLLLVIIVATVIYWHNKFKTRRQMELARNMGVNTITSTDPSSSLNSNKLDKNRQKPNVIKRLSSCCCYKKLSNFSGCHKHFRPPNLIASCAANNRGDHIRSQINSSILNNNNSSIAYQKTQNQTSSEDLDGSTSEAGITLNENSNENTMIRHENKRNNQELIISQLQINNSNNNANIKRAPAMPNACHIATGSHVTLSSHFEENNWDYNFATRGLYLSQPWVRGKYVHALGSESMATSTVLTLDPVLADLAVSNEKKPKKLVDIYSNEESGSSESDGYYA